MLTDKQDYDEIYQKYKNLVMKAAYKTFMPRILGTTINETYMGHDWVFSCLP